MVCVMGRQLWLFAAFALVSGTVQQWKVAQGNAQEDPFTGCIVSFVDGCMNPGHEELNLRSLASLQLVCEENEYESLCLARAQETYQACGNEQVHNLAVCLSLPAVSQYFQTLSLYASLSLKHTRMHTQTHTHMQTRTHTHTCTYAHVHTHTHTHIHTQTQVHTRTHTYTHTQTHVHIHKYKHIYIHTSTHTHTHTHVHTHTHTHTGAHTHTNTHTGTPAHTVTHIRTHVLSLTHT